jgi:hypothetical protein
MPTATYLQKIALQGAAPLQQIAPLSLRTVSTLTQIKTPIHQNTTTLGIRTQDACQRLKTAYLDAAISMVNVPLIADIASSHTPISIPAPLSTSFQLFHPPPLNPLQPLM